MGLIPYGTASYTCADEPDRFAIRLASVVKPGNYRLRVPEGSFYGEVSGSSFKLLTGPAGAFDIKGECFFFPVMKGRIGRSGEGTLVSIRFRPTWFNLTATLLLVGVLMFAAGILVLGIRASGTQVLREPPRWPGLLMGASPAVFAALYYLYMLRRFWAQVGKLKNSQPGRIGCRPVNDW